MVSAAELIDSIYGLTPVEFVGSMHLKREDKFAPLGYGGINGSKVRQCIYLVDKFCNGVDRRYDPLGLVSGASVKSSQLSVGTIVALGYAMPSVHVIGATTPESAIKHEQVKIADHFGAKFVISKVAYNPVLQSKAKSLIDNELKGWFYLEYGSSMDHIGNSNEEVAKFHAVGAYQLRNIPDSVDTLIVPTGSCNTLVSIVYGIRMFNKPINKIICLQIGPDKQQYTREKLTCIENVTGLDLNGIEREYHKLNERWSYQNDVLYDFHGIEMHPTYEGKCFQYLEENPELVNEHSCFWLTGSKPYLHNMIETDPEPATRIQLYA